MRTLYQFSILFSSCLLMDMMNDFHQRITCERSKYHSWNRRYNSGSAGICNVKASTTLATIVPRGPAINTIGNLVPKIAMMPPPTIRYTIAISILNNVCTPSINNKQLDNTPAIKYLLKPNTAQIAIATSANNWNSL